MQIFLYFDFDFYYFVALTSFANVFLLFHILQHYLSVPGSKYMTNMKVFLSFYFLVIFAIFRVSFFCDNFAQNHSQKTY